MRPGGLCLVLLMLLGLVALGAHTTIEASTVTVQCTSPIPTSIQSILNSSQPYDTIILEPCTYHERLVLNKPVHLVGANRASTILDGQGLGTVILVNSSNVDIRGLTIKNSDDLGWGIHVQKSSNITITGNTLVASSDGDAVNLYRGNNVNITGNFITGNLYGVNATLSQRIRIAGNVVYNDTYGVQLLSTGKSLVYNNAILACEEGVDLVSSSNNNVSQNLIKGNQIYGLSFTANSTNPTPSQFSHNNMITGNNFQRNNIGVSILNATGNWFYQNNFFLTNVTQVNLVAGSTVSPNYWDNSTRGGTVGGNYWDDYTGLDPNHDGIGDTAYAIGNGNQDPRPLMAPVPPVPVLTKGIVQTTGTGPLKVGFGALTYGTLTPFSYLWSFGDGSANSTAASPVHTFGQAGNYTVTLTIRDAGGFSDTLSTRTQATGQNPPSTTLDYIPIFLAAFGVGATIGAFLALRRSRKNRRQN
jgi:parallel beta-helix repeat protein